MPCKQWKNEWVARLYDEMDPEEERALDRHLEECAACRGTLDELSRSSRLLRESAPAVPQTPRVVVLEPRRRRQAVWAFASGLAAALLVFASGIYVGHRMPAPATTSPAAAALPSATSDEAADELRAQLAVLEERLDELSARPARREEPPAAQAAMVTRDDLDRRFTRFEDRIQTDRARDVEFLLGEINATEWRAGNWVDETRQAFRSYVALATDPRVSEQ